MSASQAALVALAVRGDVLRVVLLQLLDLLLRAAQAPGSRAQVSGGPTEPRGQPWGEVMRCSFRRGTRERRSVDSGFSKIYRV